MIVRLRPRTAAGAVAPDVISKEIEERLRRVVGEDAHGIHVALDDSRVVLEGRGHSWAEASAAEVAAWSIPGITDVVNRLEIAA